MRLGLKAVLVCLSPSGRFGAYELRVVPKVVTERIVMSQPGHESGHATSATRHESGACLDLNLKYFLMCAGGVATTCSSTMVSLADPVWLS